MKANDIMTAPAITVEPDASVRDIARVLVEHQVSAVPVVDSSGRLAGIVSEGDLIRRPELGTQRGGNWWLRAFATDDEQASQYVHSHGMRAREVMTKDVVTADEDTPVSRIADLLERHHIKRVPVVRDGGVVGIVSRSNLVQSLAAIEAQVPETVADDRELRHKIMRSLNEAGQGAHRLNVIVHGGRAQVWGAVESEAEHEAVRVAVERVVPAERVDYRVGVLSRSVQSSGL